MPPDFPNRVWVVFYSDSPKYLWGIFTTKKKAEKAITRALEHNSNLEISNDYISYYEVNYRTKNKPPRYKE